MTDGLVGFEVFVVDTSSLIELEQISKLNRQEIFQRLAEHVRAKRVIVPNDVSREFKRKDKKSFLAVWSSPLGKFMEIEMPSSEAWRHVMNVAGEVVDHSKTKQDADPMVLAVAWSMFKRGFSVVVVTEEKHDYPDHISMPRACHRLGLPCINLAEFRARLSL